MSGKIILKSEANKLFGAVINSIKIDKKLLRDSLTKSSNRLFFKIIGNDFVILGDNRTIIYPLNLTIGRSEVLHGYDLSLIQELIDSDENDYVFAEERKEVFSISSDIKTLEYGLPCPPDC